MTYKFPVDEKVIKKVNKYIEDEGVKTGSDIAADFVVILGTDNADIGRATP